MIKQTLIKLNCLLILVETHTHTHYTQPKYSPCKHIFNCRAPSEQADSLSSLDSFPQSTSSISSYPLQEEHFTTPSNFKTHAMFYGENDPVPDLEQNVADLINSLFWVVESKRLERSKEKLEKVSLLLAPFEKKDFVGECNLGIIWKKVLFGELFCIFRVCITHTTAHTCNLHP